MAKKNDIITEENTNKGTSANNTGTLYNRIDSSQESEKPMNIEEFKKLVEEVAVKKLDFVFSNPGKEHAGVVLCSMAKHADSDFKVFDDNLEGDITDNTDFYELIGDLLARGGKFSIITKKNPEDNESKKKVLRLKQRYAENVEVCYINDMDLLQDDEKDLLNANFSVVDGKSYRLEYDFEKRKAFFNFNDQVTGQRLINKFNKIKNLPTIATI
jgi:hypothetical protein